jgi:hypothetical protein
MMPLCHDIAIGCLDKSIIFSSEVPAGVPRMILG